VATKAAPEQEWPGDNYGTTIGVSEMGWRSGNTSADGAVDRDYKTKAA
jgi:hypothetical protein